MPPLKSRIVNPLALAAMPVRGMAKNGNERLACASSTGLGIHSARGESHRVHRVLSG